MYPYESSLVAFGSLLGLAAMDVLAMRCRVEPLRRLVKKSLSKAADSASHVPPCEKDI